MKINNLPNLEDMFKHILEKINKARTKKDFELIAYDSLNIGSVQIFKQLWGNTVLGFDITEDGVSTIGGCAMTEAYTTVMYEQVLKVYFVFFGDSLCYCVGDPTKEFFEDLANQRMVSKRQAEERY